MAKKVVTKAPRQVRGKQKKDISRQARDKKPAQTGVFHAHLIRPRITEKASMNAQGNVYMFEVGSDTTKVQVRKAVIEAYKVTPVKVNMSPIRGKLVMSRGKYGATAKGKKAYVYLKKGDEIQFV